MSLKQYGRPPRVLDPFAVGGSIPLEALRLGCETYASEHNPVTNSGHEVCVWPYKGGIAALLTTDGPEKNTIQYAADGINFEIVAVLKGAPEALGLFRSPDPDPDGDPLEGIRWGLCHEYRGGWQYIRRFDTVRPRVRVLE